MFSKYFFFLCEQFVLTMLLERQNVQFFAALQAILHEDSLK